MKSRIQLPVYNDGVAKIYRICEADDIQATKYLNILECVYVIVN